MNTSRGASVRKSSKKTRNTIIRLFTVVFIIASTYYALKEFGFFDKAITYSPTTVSSYNSFVHATKNASYEGSGIFESASASDMAVGTGNINFSSGITETRAKYTEIIGDSKDVFTVMIYMCGSDSETDYGLASADIEEMLNATKSSKLNIIIQTGGALDWHNSKVSSGKVERFKISNGKITSLASSQNADMTNYANLTSFIIYCKNKYPANRYAMVFWGNGSGSSYGFGYDEMSDKNNSMTIDEINQAIYASGVKFDFVGFDCPYMATYDTAYTMNFYADYLIASQESVPSVGWNYTNWLSAIAENTSISTCEIAKIIIDDYAQACVENSKSNTYTLSLIDLTDFNNLVYPAMANFSNSIDGLMSDGKFYTVSRARIASREFGDTSFDQIDLMEFAARLGTSEASELIDALKATVRYNVVSSNTVNANGLSLYFPCNNFNNFSNTINIFHRINMCKSYSNAIRKFANIAVGGQRIYDTSSSAQASGSSSLALSGIVPNPNTSNEFGWLDNNFVESCSAYYKKHSLDGNDLAVSTVTSTSGDSYNAFSLSRSQWNLIGDIAMEAYVYDNENGCYKSLGEDIPSFTYLTEDKLHLAAEFPSLWLSINDINVYAQVVSVEEYDTLKKVTYRVPVYITPATKNTDEDENTAILPSSQYTAYLYITKDNRYSGTYSLAYVKRTYTNGETETESKTVQLNVGDIITPQYKYYDENLNEIAVSSSDLSAASTEYNEGIKIYSSAISSNEDILAFYKFTDVYGNIFRTQVNMSTD